MISIFACPKKFSGHFGTIQRNAIISWKQLHSDVDIILLGQESGVAEICNDLSIRHIPDIDVNENGTPLMSSIFKHGIEKSKFSVKVFINSDIILFETFTRAIQLCTKRFHKFLLIGQCHNLDVEFSFDGSTTDWQSRVIRNCEEHGTLRGELGIDFFAFIDNPWPSMPDFAIGRPGYDNWMVGQVWKNGMTIIDATENVLAIHQNHDYSHAGSGAREDVYKGPEATANFYKMKTGDQDFGIYDATYSFVGDSLVPARKPKYVYRRIIRFWQRWPLLSRVLFFNPVKYFRSWLFFR